jgi:tripartite-type tricarboxylate transporter receptor subunit TctC
MSMNTRIPAILAAAMLAMATPAAAQEWPSRPLRLLVGAAPGGLTDILARRLQEPLSAALGQTVVVENRPGASGVIATETMVRSNDGHTISMVVSTHASALAIQQRLSFDPVRDVAPVVLIGRIPLLIAVNPQVPATNLAESVALARGRAGNPLAYATPGIALAQHFTGESLALRAGITLTHVPYRGAAPAINDVVAGNVPIGIISPASAAPLVADNRLRAIALSGTDRIALLPGVPTVAEQGFPGFEVNEWYGVAAPAAQPAAQVARLNRAVVDIMTQPANRAWLDSMAMQGGLGSPADFAAFIQSEIARLTQVARAANIRAE